MEENIPKGAGRLGGRNRIAYTRNKNIYLFFLFQYWSSVENNFKGICSFYKTSEDDRSSAFFPPKAEIFFGV